MAMLETFLGSGAQSNVIVIVSNSAVYFAAQILFFHSMYMFLIYFNLFDIIILVIKSSSLKTTWK